VAACKQFACSSRETSNIYETRKVKIVDSNKDEPNGQGQSMQPVGHENAAGCIVLNFVRLF